MARDAFQTELESLRDSVIALGTEVREAVDESMVALRQADVRRSRALIQRLQGTAARRWSIEERTVVAVAEQQPVASDCRRLVGFLEMLTDLSRMGDHARGIAEINGLMGTTAPPRRLGFLPSMADRALAMLDDALRALREDDADRARHVLQADDDLDRLQERVYSDAFRAMIEDPSRAEEQTYMLWVAHNLERVGDRATNVSESLIFMVTGRREYADSDSLPDGLP
ncbi:MAG: phosphate signaling complex protein PhoU [Dehalococcoidia bacterium]